jgi:peptidoglycan/LPS O-acetylase OafA/YrhL
LTAFGLGVCCGIRQLVVVAGGTGVLLYDEQIIAGKIGKTVATDLQSRFRLGYRPALDGVRGISILAVMWVHGGLFWFGRGGFLGVDIFFVLSGFLITTLLIQEWEQSESISFGSFYIRRGLRLLPPLFVLIMASLVVAAIYPEPDGFVAKSKSILVALFYLANWLPVYHALFHTWSLGIEEQFYIVWPFLLFLLLRPKLNRRAVVLIMVAGVAVIAYHRALLWQHGGDPVRVYTGLDTRADSLLIGGIIGALISWNMIPRKRWLLSALRVIAVLSIFGMAFFIITIPSISPFLYYGGYTLIAVMVASVITNLFYAPLNVITSVLELPALRWFGRLSYGLYLWHFPVYRAYDFLFPTFPVKSYTLSIFIPFIFKFTLAVLVATVSFYVIEQPALRLKKRFRAISSKNERAGAVRLAVATGGGNQD